MPAKAIYWLPKTPKLEQEVLLLELDALESKLDAL